MTDKHSFNLTSLHLEDLPGDRRHLAEHEIRSMIGHFERRAIQFGLEEDVILNVVLTQDIEPHVNRISESYGKVSKEPFSPNRNTVAVYGITLTHPQSPPLRASVVLNQEIWTKDDGESVAVRVYLLLHELGHVLQQVQGTGASWRRSEHLATTNEEQVRREGRILWDEFDADIVADQICRDFLLRTDEGKPIGAGDFLVKGFVRCAADLLERICKFVVDDVHAYRCHLGPLEHLYPTSFALIQELLRILAHTAALCVGMQVVEDLTEILRALRGFNEYIGDDWQAFFDALTEESGHAAESELARIWDGVMGRIGLEIEDMPDGQQYVHVFEPVFCCDSDAEDDNPAE